MKRFNDIKIGTRILIGFLIVIFIAGIIGGVGIYSLQHVNTSYRSSYEDGVDALDLMEKISSSFQRSRMNIYGLVLADTSLDKDFYLERVRSHENTMNEGIATYQNILSVYDSDEIRDILDHLDNLIVSVEKYSTLRDNFVSTLGRGAKYRMEAYNELKDGELHSAALEVDEAINNIINYEKEFAHSEIDRNVSLATSASIIMLAVLGVGIITAIIIALYISRSISKRIASLIEVSDKISSGDLSATIEIESNDEISILARSFQNMANNLIAIINDITYGLDAMSSGDFTVSSKVQEPYVGDYVPLMEAMYKMITRISETIRHINLAAEQVAAGSEQLSSGAQALASGAAEQASSVEELTASAERIAEQADENSVVVTAASKSVDQAGVGVRAGNEHMNQLAQAMTDISSTSNQIANITKVIEDIAFQTNILALNAAIEAARAGNAGKGFAVVADEVRNLAAKSAEAAQQTATLIQSSVVAVEKGAEITSETAQILRDVGTSMAEVTDSFAKIEESIAEQTTAIEQTKDGLSQISAVVQTNAATAEENSAASEEISAQAAALRVEIEKFKILGGATKTADQSSNLLSSNDSQDLFVEPALNLDKY